MYYCILPAVSYISASSPLLLASMLAPQTSSDKGIVFPTYACHIYTHRSE